MCKVSRNAQHFYFTYNHSLTCESVCTDCIVNVVGERVRFRAMAKQRDKIASLLTVALRKKNLVKNSFFVNFPYDTT